MHDNETERPPALGVEQARLSLLVMSRVGVYTFPLPEWGDVIIGRAADCHVRVEDPKASRYHAKLHVRPRLEVIDNGSANGTFIAGRRLEPHRAFEVAVGDMLTVGSTVLVLQTAATHAPLRVWSQSAFEARVDEERARAQRQGATAGYAIAVLTLAGKALADVSTSTRGMLTSDVAKADLLERTLRASLRASDVIGSFAPGVYEALLVEVDEPTAKQVAAALGRALREAGFDLGVELQWFGPGEARRAEPRVALPPPPATAPSPQAEVASAVDEVTIDRIASSSINVLILGETGAGKEVMARRLHERSPRADAPLLCLNCAALSESLLESELFGFEKGAFTGATQSKPGLLESAQGGTVFLDEIGEMPLVLQAKLLRVLEQREVLRLGALKPHPIDVRFLSATNRNLEVEVEARRFRQDLYFRLNGIAVTVPPLRERPLEIEPLALAFIAEACAQSRRNDIPDLSPTALALVKRYAWPGNVRELRNVMERAVVLCAGDVIGTEHLPADKMAPTVELGSLPSGSDGASGAPFPAERETIPGRALEDIYRSPSKDRERIVQALTQCNGNQTQAAKLLGVSRRTLVTWLGQHNLPRPRKGGS